MTIGNGPSISDSSSSSSVNHHKHLHTAGSVGAGYDLAYDLGGGSSVSSSLGLLEGHQHDGQGIAALLVLIVVLCLLAYCCWGVPIFRSLRRWNCGSSSSSSSSCCCTGGGESTTTTPCSAEDRCARNGPLGSWVLGTATRASSVNANGINNNSTANQSRTASSILAAQQQSHRHYNRHAARQAGAAGLQQLRIGDHNGPSSHWHRNQQQTHSMVTPTIILLPHGRMLVVDGSIFTQLQSDVSGLDLMELGESVMRAQRGGSNPQRPHSSSVATHQHHSVRSQLRASPETPSKDSMGSIGCFPPPTYESIYGKEEGADMPPSYSEILLHRLANLPECEMDAHQQQPPTSGSASHERRDAPAADDDRSKDLELGDGSSSSNCPRIIANPFERAELPFNDDNNDVAADRHRLRAVVQARNPSLRTNPLDDATFYSLDAMNDESNAATTSSSPRHARRTRPISLQQGDSESDNEARYQSRREHRSRRSQRPSSQDRHSVSEFPTSSHGYSSYQRRREHNEAMNCRNVASSRRLSADPITDLHPATYEEALQTHRATNGHPGLDFLPQMIYSSPFHRTSNDGSQISRLSVNLTDWNLDDGDDDRVGVANAIIDIDDDNDDVDDEETKHFETLADIRESRV